MLLYLNLGKQRPMIQQDIDDLIRHLLQQANDFHPTLHYARNLREYDCTTSFLAADIFILEI
jgi:hypothetical protein